MIFAFCENEKTVFVSTLPDSTASHLFAFWIDFSYLNFKNIFVAVLLPYVGNGIQLYGSPRRFCKIYGSWSTAWMKFFLLSFVDFPSMWLSISPGRCLAEQLKYRQACWPFPTCFTKILCVWEFVSSNMYYKFKFHPISGDIFLYRVYFEIETCITVLHSLRRQWDKIEADNFNSALKFVCFFNSTKNFLWVALLLNQSKICWDFEDIWNGSAKIRLFFLAVHRKRLDFYEIRYHTRCFT
jgi:hypothetical protein